MLGMIENVYARYNTEGYSNNNGHRQQNPTSKNETSQRELQKLSAFQSGPSFNRAPSRAQ